MVLEICDRSLRRLGVIDKIDTLIWTRRYWKPGGFKILVPFSLIHRELLSKENLVYKRDDLEFGKVELGEVQYMRVAKNQEGSEMIEAEGRFITGWISDRVVLNKIVTVDRPQNIIQRIIRENVIQPSNSARQIDNIAIMGVTDIERNSIEYASEFMENALAACETVAINSKLGFRILTDLRAGTNHFQIYDGNNYAVNQSENPPRVFREEFDNIREQEYTNSVENYKTTAYVAGGEQGEFPRRMVEVGNAALGHDRKEVFINASDIRQHFRDETGQEITLTNAQVDGLLRQRGVSELDFFQEVLSYSAKIKPKSNLNYRTDYDVGDRITKINERWGLQIDVRITEAAEVYKRDSKDVEITFGENLPTLIESLRHIYK